MLGDGLSRPFSGLKSDSALTQQFQLLTTLSRYTE